MEPFLVKKHYRDLELSFLGILVFRGTFGSIRPNFAPVLTNSDLFQTNLPGGPDLFSHISTYFAGRTSPIFTCLDLFCFTIRLRGRDT